MTNCPAVLTENLFMDNKEDVQLLLSAEGKNKIVNLHIKGILEYLNKIK
jgi:N-acetylmuramoyl-L-alanine amidase